MKLNRTTQRTVAILKLVSKHPKGIILDEICGLLDLPKTSAYDIITTLVSLGMVNVDHGRRQHYTIGLTVYRIGVRYTSSLDILNVLEPELRSFAREVGKTVFFGVRSGYDVIYICKFEPENPIITTANVGTKNPMYCTSLGKAMLVFSDEDSLEEILSGIRMEPKTEWTIRDRETLLAELERVRERGYAFDSREFEEHMQCVGAPVFGKDGSLLGAISVSGLYKASEDYGRLGALVSEKAARVSRLLGFIPQDALTNGSGADSRG